MPIVSGNDPRQSGRNGGSLLAWVVPLLIFGPTLYRMARNVVGGRVTDQQFLIGAGGLVALVVLVVIMQRINRMRNAGGSGLPQAYSSPSALPQVTQLSSTQSSDAYLSSAPKYEPMVTGKVVVAGVVLAVLMLGVGWLLLL